MQERNRDINGAAVVEDCSGDSKISGRSRVSERNPLN